MSELSALDLSTNLSDLCPRCKAIPLDDILSHPERIKYSRGVLITSLGSVTQWDTSHCAFCSLLLAVCPAPLSSEFELFAFSSKRSYDMGFVARGATHPFETVLLGVIPNPLPPGPSGYAQKRKQLLSTTGFIASLASPFPTAGPGFQAQFVEPRINFDVLRRWMDTCLTVHQRKHSILANNSFQNNGSSNRTSSLRSLRLIDCHARRISEATPQCEYIALSYVWGSPSLDDSNSAIHISLGSLPNSLPPTIEDAIAVVLQLGLRYLWIDRYCIDQNDPVDRHNQIKNMDQIYKYAKATIVAAAGIDPTHGLPGVGHRLRQPHPHARVRDHVLVSTLPDARGLIDSSVWKTRAWTYQEAVFSTRRIIFTDQQVYFECSIMRCCEAVHTSPELLYRKSKVSENMHEPIFKSTHGGEIDLKHHIKSYSRLKLTYDSDVLNGMLGLFRTWEEHSWPIYHFFGTPICLTENNVASNDVDAGFLNGLTWGSAKPSPRRVEFPSWSWTGWMGPVRGWAVCAQIADHDKLFSTFSSDVIQFWIVQGNERPVKWEKVYQSVMRGVWTRDRIPQLLFQAWTVQLRFEWLESVPQKTWAYPNWGASWGAGFYVKCSDTPAVYSPLILSWEGGDGGDLHQKLKTEAWDCIVLGRTFYVARIPGNPFEDDFLLVVRSVGDGVERIGHVDLGHRLFSKDLVTNELISGGGFQGKIKPLNLPRTRRTILLG